MRCAICGIAGYIGSSKNINVSFYLITKLLECSESRGQDASGYWAVEKGENGRVFYNKMPIKASLFVDEDCWKLISKIDIDLFLTHARGASPGYGNPAINENNHPFVNEDKSVALVHNGKLNDVEYVFLKNDYHPVTECDSEMILKIFEIHNNLDGIKDIFSLLGEGHMAVAIGQKQLKNRNLWLFRNKHRPLWLVDVRDFLGQVFFVSDPNFWQEAVKDAPYAKQIKRCQKLVEIKPEEVWLFENEHFFNYKVKRNIVHISTL